MSIFLEALGEEEREATLLRGVIAADSAVFAETRSAAPFGESATGASLPDGALLLEALCDEEPPEKSELIGNTSN